MDTEIQGVGGTALSPSSKPLQERQRHRDLIGVEVEASLNNGGWWKEPSSDVVKARMFQKWMNVLEPYSIGEIIRAFEAHVISCPSKKPNEGYIVALIKREKNGGVVVVDAAVYWAGCIKNLGSFVSNSCFSPGLVTEMLERRLVTEGNLKKRGIQF